MASRHPWRPAHFHCIIPAEGYRSLTTEIFPGDDPFIDQDAVFGVRRELVVDLVPETDPSSVPMRMAAESSLKLPFFRVEYDFHI